jgi:hypothetical protein
MAMMMREQSITKKVFGLDLSGMDPVGITATGLAQNGNIITGTTIIIEGVGIAAIDGIIMREEEGMMAEADIIMGEDSMMKEVGIITKKDVITAVGINNRVLRVASIV